MFKLEIPRKYIQMFEMSELEEITLGVDSNFYKFNKNDFIKNGEKYVLINSYYPDSWYKEIPEPQEDLVKKVLEEFKNFPDKSLVIRRADTSVVVIMKYWDNYIEIDGNMSKAICNLEAYFQHLNNHWKIQAYIFQKLSLNDSTIFSELYRYFIYFKDWSSVAGSSGGGNITSIMTIDELNERILPVQTYDRVGPINYRLTKSFINSIKEMV